MYRWLSVPSYATADGAGLSKAVIKALESGELQRVEEF